jgi:hypothetical protein
MSSNDFDSGEGGICELCKREVETLTRHHLIPQTRHSNKRNKKQFSRTEVKERIAWLCRPCHKNVHTVLDNKELERDYNTIAALAAHPDIAKFTEWVRRRPANTYVPVRSAKR